MRELRDDAPRWFLRLQSGLRLWSWRRELAWWGALFVAGVLVGALLAR